MKKTLLITAILLSLYLLQAQATIVVYECHHNFTPYAVVFDNNACPLPPLNINGVEYVHHNVAAGVHEVQGGHDHTDPDCVVSRHLIDMNPL